MREIKFMLWDALHGCRLGPYTLEEFISRSYPKGVICEGYESCPHVDFLQYTGLKDIHSKEIYDGDIVLDNTVYDDLWDTEGLFEGNLVICPLLITWQKEEASWCLLNTKLDYIDPDPAGRKLEVIGNFYENKELL